MSSAHRALADGDRAAHDAVDAQHLQRGTGAHHVDDRVERPDFVQLHLIGRHAVHRAFHFGQHSERALSTSGHARRQVGLLDDLAYHPVGPVRTMPVAAIVAAAVAVVVARVMVVVLAVVAVVVVASWSPS